MKTNIHITLESGESFGTLHQSTRLPDDSVLISADVPLNSEQYAFFTPFLTLNKPSTQLCQYDYRDANGDLWSVIRPTLDECRRLILERMHTWNKN